MNKKEKDFINQVYLPGTSLRFQENIRKYKGIFIHNIIWIIEKEHILDLFESGFFGKGILSKSKPSWKFKNNLEIKNKFIEKEDNLNLEIKK
jgi:hypothetical protein